MTSNEEAIAFAQAVSLVFGWVYFIAWTLSFYPQIIHNWERKSTTGVAVDFSVANLVGLSSYTAYSAAFVFSPIIRDQYALRHGGTGEPSVRANDFFYGLHGFLIVIVAYSQFFPSVWGFTVGKNQRASVLMLTICGACGAVIAWAVLLVLTQDQGKEPKAGDWMWIDVIYTLGYVKLFMTIIKYTPQVYLNYKRKSMRGFRIDAIMLDVLGSVLSIAQLLIDAALAHDWSAVTGNPAKFFLGNVTLLFDFIYLWQRYVLYRKNMAKGVVTEEEASEDSPLLRDT